MLEKGELARQLICLLWHLRQHAWIAFSFAHEMFKPWWHSARLAAFPALTANIGAYKESQRENRVHGQGIAIGQILSARARALLAGAAEPLALDQSRKPVLDMHCQVTEERVCEGPLDYVTR